MLVNDLPPPFLHPISFRCAFPPHRNLSPACHISSFPGKHPLLPLICDTFSLHGHEARMS